MNPVRIHIARVSYIETPVHARDGKRVTWMRINHMEKDMDKRACQVLLVFLLFCWGRKLSVFCTTLHAKLGIILRSVFFGYS